MGMERSWVWCLMVFLLVIVECINGEDPYRFYTWNVTYGDIYPLGVKQQVLILMYFFLIQSFILLGFVFFIYFFRVLPLFDVFNYIKVLITVIGWLKNV